VEEKSNLILKVYGDPNGITALFKIPGTSEYFSFYVCTELLVWTLVCFVMDLQSCYFGLCQSTPSEDDSELLAANALAVVMVVHGGFWSTHIILRHSVAKSTWQTILSN